MKTKLQDYEFIDIVVSRYLEDGVDEIVSDQYVLSADPFVKLVTLSQRMLPARSAQLADLFRKTIDFPEQLSDLLTSDKGFVSFAQCVSRSIDRWQGMRRYLLTF